MPRASVATSWGEKNGTPAVMPVKQFAQDSLRVYAVGSCRPSSSATGCCPEVLLTHTWLDDVDWEEVDKMERLQYFYRVWLMIREGLTASISTTIKRYTVRLCNTLDILTI